MFDSPTIDSPTIDPPTIDSSTGRKTPIKNAQQLIVLVSRAKSYLNKELCEALVYAVISFSKLNN